MRIYLTLKLYATLFLTFLLLFFAQGNIQTWAAEKNSVADPHLFTLSTNQPEGIITTYAGAVGSGPATTVAQYPYDVAMFGPYVYIADPNYHVVRRLDTTTGLEEIVAGNGESGYSGDNGPAINAKLRGPSGVAVDAVGNLYIADLGNHCIRKVDTSGTITTVAGNGNQGYSGDNGLAISAKLSKPLDVTVDEASNLYIADGANDRVRKVDTSGFITTIAGNGQSGYSGDNGPATSAKLSPSDVAVDGAGNLYIADFRNSRIRRVDASGIITTMAGNGRAIRGTTGWPQTRDSAGLHVWRWMEPATSSLLIVETTASVRWIQAASLQP